MGVDKYIFHDDRYFSGDYIRHNYNQLKADLGKIMDELSFNSHFRPCCLL